MAEAEPIRYHFTPGEFVRYIASNGDACIGHISSLGDYSLAVQQWVEDLEHRFDRIFFNIQKSSNISKDVHPSDRLISSIIKQ